MTKFANVISAVRWIGLVLAGVLFWMLGLVALGVPPDLKTWRHFLGIVLCMAALKLWGKAAVLILGNE